MAHAPGPEPPCPECLRWRGARSWCGRTSDRRERGATVAWLAGASRGAALHFESRPERSGAEWRTPRSGVGAGKPCGTIVSHVERQLFSACSDPKGFGPARRRGWTAAVNAAEHPSPSDRLNSAAEAEPHRRCALRRSSRISSKSPQRMAIDEAGRHLAAARAFCTSPAFDPDRGTGVRCARRAPRRREQGDPG